MPAATGRPDVGHVAAEPAGLVEAGAELGVTGAKLFGRGTLLAAEVEAVPIDPAIAEDPETPGVRLLVFAGPAALREDGLTAIVEGCVIVTEDGAVGSPAGAAGLVTVSAEELDMAPGDALGAVAEIAGALVGG